jgi:hypothetical protein
MTNNNENQTTQKDWDDFFAPENDPQTAFDSMDQDWVGMYMVSEHGSWKKYETTEPVDEAPVNYKGPPPGYVFDR